jgi:Sulfotransferase domain
VYEVKDGWEPLCEFLNVEVPEGKPFPRLNDTTTFRQRRKRFMIIFAASVSGVLLAGLALLYFLASRRASGRY